MGYRPWAEHSKRLTRIAGKQRPFVLSPFEALILETDVLDEIVAQHQFLKEPDSKRTRVRFGVLDGDVDLHDRERRPPEALRDPADVGERTADQIEPPTVTEVCGGHDELLALPAGHRVAVPPRLRLAGRERTAVREDL